MKTTLSKIDPVVSNIQNSPSKYGQKWDNNNTHRHDRLGSRLDMKYSMQLVSGSDPNVDPSPRNSREIVEKDLEGVHQRTPDRDRSQDMYRYLCFHLLNKFIC